MSLLLQTISHHKPQKGHSHPLSTEVLSGQLEGIAQFTEIKLAFRPTEGDVMGSYVPGSDGGKLHGAAASKMDGYREFLQCSWSSAEGWSLVVNSVPSTRKAEIKARCERRVMPLLRKWLSEKREESWFTGRHALQWGVSEFSDELAMRETHNDRIVAQEEYLNRERAS